MNLLLHSFKLAIFPKLYYNVLRRKYSGQCNRSYGKNSEKTAIKISRFTVLKWIVRTSNDDTS